MKEGGIPACGRQALVMGDFTKVTKSLVRFCRHLLSVKEE
jgi:hypothetical protein